MGCLNIRCSAYGKCNLTARDCAFFKGIDKAPKSKTSNQTTTEDKEQETVIEYCELKHIVAVHIPNESKRSLAYGAKMKRMGLRKGFPDIFIPTPSKGYHGLFIELKRDKTCKATAEQRKWINHLNDQGYRAAVCYGAGEAIEEIDWYFNEK